MKTRKIQVTARQMDKLISNLRTLPDEPVGDHLSDDEFIGYAMKTLTAEEVQRVDQHLASCVECATEMERLVEASKVWRGEQGEERLNALRQRVTATSTPFVLWSDIALRIAAKTPMVEDGQVETEHGILRWRIVEDEARNLTVRFGSHAMELEDGRLRLTAGNLQREVVLGRVASDQVGAEAIITRDERAQLPEGAKLHVELVREAPEARSTS